MLSKATSRTVAAPPSAVSELMHQHQQQQQQLRHPLVQSWHHGMVVSVTGVNPAIAPAIRLAKR